MKEFFQSLLPEIEVMLVVSAQNPSHFDGVNFIFSTLPEISSYSRGTLLPFKVSGVETVAVLTWWCNDCPESYNEILRLYVDAIVEEGEMLGMVVSDLSMRSFTSDICQELETLDPDLVYVAALNGTETFYQECVERGYDFRGYVDMVERNVLLWTEGISSLILPSDLNLNPISREYVFTTSPWSPLTDLPGEEEEYFGSTFQYASNFNSR
jgi:hypothetical protein